MKTSISCLPVSLYPEFYNGTRTIVQWSEQAAWLGLDSIDINGLFIREKPTEALFQIRKELAVPVLMVSAYSDFTCPSEEKRAEILCDAVGDIWRAKAIGAKYIRLTAGQAYPGASDEEMIQRVFDCFVHCAKAAGEAGVEILLENHSKPGAWTYPDFNFHEDRFLALWEALRSLPVSVNFDTANAYALKNWPRLLEAVSGRVATIHLNDLASVNPLVFARVGEGIVPLEQIVQAVYETGFSGEICLEEASFQGWAGLVAAVSFTKKLCNP